MKEAIEQALRRKNRARTAREKGDFGRAAQHIEEARRQLEALWDERRVAIDRAGAGASGEERELVDALADIYGIRGGIHRSLEQYADAVSAYDRGLVFEAHPARTAASSYNLVQRLANRALLRPAEIGRNGWTVEGVEMWKELRGADQVLREQLTSSRAGDPWAAADMVFLQVLLAPQTSPDAGVDEAWRRLQSLKPKGFVYASTRRALEDLQKRMESVPEAERSDGWKVVAEWLDRLVARFRHEENLDPV